MGYTEGRQVEGIPDFESFDGCFHINNALEVEVYTLNGGVASAGGPTNLCSNKGSTPFQAVVAGAVGPFGKWALFFEDGSLVATAPAPDDIDAQGLPTGTYILYHVAPTEPGDPEGVSCIGNLPNCADLSNGITSR